MSSRRGRNAGGIRGPHSALTDFLAANNISAQEIRDSYRQRVQQSEQQTGQEPEENGEGPSNQDQEGDDAAEDEEPAESSTMASERSRKRKRNQEEAIAKVKKGKEAKKKTVNKKQKKKRKGGSDDEDDSDYDVTNMYKKSKPVPGQLENCDICSKRFTVTPYSKSGPDGGLLCAPCGKEMAKELKANDKANKKPVVRKGRRKVESNRLDGLTQRGAKTLQQLCIEKLAKHSEDIEEFGELPEPIMNRLSEIFSKKRAMNPSTVKLFLRPDMDTVAIWESAYLETEDYDQIFAVVPRVSKLVLRNCCQLKDVNMTYMIEKAKNLKHIQLNGANLISNEKWAELFIARGVDLESLKLEWLDAAFDDESVEALTTFCPNLKRLKLERCRQIGVEAIEAIAKLEHLEHLTLRLNEGKEVPRERLVNLIGNVGANLRTLCLERFIDPKAEEVTNDVPIAIHDTCRHLSKLRFTENDECSDAGYAALFTHWANPPLRYIDLSSTRDVDNANPEGPDEPVGLASAGFEALMAHSGRHLEYLNIASCRHISFETLTNIFDGQKKYPNLEEINLSFCSVVDTAVVAGVFRSCPQLKKVVTFGCFLIKDIEVPRGIVLIGAPKAQDAIEQFGEVFMDFQKEMMKEMEGMGPMGRIVPAAA